MSEPTGDARRLRLLLLVLVVGAGLVHALYCSGGLIDDSYISFRYARHLANGEGLTFNVGQAPVEGYTNFSWVLLSALVFALGGDAETVMPWLGLLCAAGLTVTVAQLAPRLAGEQQRPMSGLIAALVLAANPTLAYYATSGLETPLFAWLVVAACAMLVLQRPRAFAALILAACLTRPEAALLGLVGAAWFTGQSARGALSWRASLEVLGSFALVGAAYASFKFFYFGSLLPNTFYAKPPDTQGGLRYVLWPLVDYIPLLLVALVSLLRPPRWSKGALLLLLAALEFAVVIVTGGDWMLLFRRLLPAFGLLALAVDAPVLACFDLGSGWRRWGRILVIVACAAYVPIGVPDSRAARELAVSTVTYDVARARVLSDLEGGGVRSIATFDIGLPGYLLPNVEFVDLSGLTDAEIASGEGKHFHKLASPEYLSQRNPDVLLLTARVPPVMESAQQAAKVTAYYPAEQHLLGLEWTRQNYERDRTYQIHRSYFLHVFLRRGSAPSAPGPASATHAAPLQ